MTYKLTVFVGRDEMRLESRGLPSRESAARIAEAIAHSGKAMRFDISEEVGPTDKSDSVIT